LSKVENSNNFAKAEATYHEQLMAEGYKRLIANSTNCWKLLHLLESLAERKKPEDGEASLKI